MRPIDYFDQGADAYPDRAAIVDAETGASYTFREARAESERIARALWAAGLVPGGRAAIFSPNDIRVLLATLGLLRAGGYWIPINPRNALEANIDFMKHTETEWLFYHSSFAHMNDEIRARVPTLRHLVCLDAEEGGNPSLEQFAATGEGAEELDWADACGNPDHLVGLFATGGTTGAAKAVMFAYRSWATYIETGCRHWRVDDAEPVCLATAPLTHAAGVVAMALFTLGGTNVVMPRFDAPAVLRAIERFRVTHLFLPPTAFYALLAQPDVRSFDYSSLRRFLIAAAPVSPDKLKEGIEVFGPCLCQCYGQVEAPMLLTALDPEVFAAAAAGDHPERLASCGKPTYKVRLAIMDDDGRLLPPGERGEIVARSNLVNPGYYRNEEATAAIRAYGWHHTGDVGYRDEDGYFYIVDRKKDMIITGGFNVYSAEVEAGLLELPGVRECAVVGVPDDHWGEAVKGIVVLREAESLTEQDVIAHCKARLGGVKAPKSVEFWPELPKTPAGKVDKKAIRTHYWAGAERAVH